MARTAEREAEGRRDAAIETLRLAELEEVRLTSDLSGIDANRKRLAFDLARELETMSDDDLARRLPETKAEEARAVIGYDDARRAADGLDEEKLTTAPPDHRPAAHAPAGGSP